MYHKKFSRFPFRYVQAATGVLRPGNRGGGGTCGPSWAATGAETLFPASGFGSVSSSAPMLFAVPFKHIGLACWWAGCALMAVQTAFSQTDSLRRAAKQAAQQKTAALKANAALANNKRDSIGNHWRNKTESVANPLRKAAAKSGQRIDSLTAMADIDGKAARKLARRYEKLSGRIGKATESALAGMEKRERKLFAKMAKKDSTGAAKGRAAGQQSLASLRRKMALPDKPMATGGYLPGLDSVATALKYAKTKPRELAATGTTVPKADPKERLQTAAANLRGNLRAADQAGNYIAERQSELKSRYGAQWPQLGNELKGMEKERAYFDQSMAMYRDGAKDLRPLESKTIAAVSKQPAFQAFMARNSELAGLFRLPENYGDPSALSGLQNRAALQKAIERKFGAGAGPAAFLRQQLDAGKTQLRTLQEKAAKGTGNGNPAATPGFRPDGQKGKPFRKRLELGWNLQSQRPNGLLPVTTDLGGSAGYKLTDNMTLGIGASFKLGWGNSIGNIGLSAQGAGLRSFLDGRLKKSIWLTGALEQNYYAELASKAGQNIRLRNGETHGLGADWGKGWQESCLIGLTKKSTVRKKTAYVQLLVDLMAERHLPATPWLVYRAGIAF